MIQEMVEVTLARGLWICRWFPLKFLLHCRWHILLECHILQLMVSGPKNRTHIAKQFQNLQKDVNVRITIYHLSYHTTYCSKTIFKQFQTSKQSSTQSSTISLHPSTSYIFIIYPPLFKDGNGQFPIKFCFFKKMMKFLKKFKLQGFKPFTNYFWVAIRMIKSRASCRVKRSFTVRCKVRTSHARKV